MRGRRDPLDEAADGGAPPRPDNPLRDEALAPSPASGDDVRAPHPREGGPARPMRSPKLGRHVIYHHENGQNYPAIITRVHTLQSVDLTIFSCDHDEPVLRVRSAQLLPDHGGSERRVFQAPCASWPELG